MSKNAKLCLEEASKVIQEFLKENGGLSNGYETYADLLVEPHVISRPVKWSTPRMDDLTVREVKDKGRKLYSQLHEILKKYGVDGINVTPSHIEEGCYNTIVTVVPKEVKKWTKEVRVPW